MTRKSKREIEQKLDELDPDPFEDYPSLDNLALLFGYDWEPVEDSDRLLRREETGEVYHFPQEFQEVLEDVLLDAEDNS